jgi:hypothetical protein
LPRWQQPARFMKLRFASTGVPEAGVIGPATMTRRIWFKPRPQGGAVKLMAVPTTSKVRLLCTDSHAKFRR